MAARQLWVFLTEQDVQTLLQRLEARDPGVVASQGRYLRGEVRALLDAPGSLERRESVAGERRLYLFHRRHSTELVVHQQPFGPFAGWSQIDEERSDCLVLRLPDAPVGTLQPAALYGHVVNWRGAEKVRKKPRFSVWAGQTLKALLQEFPPTSVKFMRTGPDALARARRGELQLTYLLRPIAPEPLATPHPQPAPPADVVTEENVDLPGDDPPA